MIYSPYLKSAGFVFVPIECFLGFMRTGEFFSMIKSIKTEIKFRSMKNLYNSGNYTDDAKSLKKSFK